tara:strand:- start:175 stop:399 length:225 start_codon:yes stop_codon:yes gene_type:complete
MSRKQGENMIEVVDGAKLGPGEITAINHAVELARFEKETLGKKIKSRWIGFGFITEMPDGSIKFERAKGMFQFK